MMRWKSIRRLWRVPCVIVLLAQVGPFAQVPVSTLPGRTSGVLEDQGRELLPTTPVSLELRDAEIKDVLRTLGQQFHLNLLVHEESKGLISVSMRNVPLRDALTTLADMANLIIVPAPGGILTILPVKAYEERLKARAALATQAETVSPAALPPLITQKIDVQYAYDPRKAVSGVGKEIGLGDEKKDLSELVENLKKHLSGRPGANISVISRSNALLVTDIPEKVEEIASLLTTIDVPSMTVGIEARIAEISGQGLEDLGIQWGGVGRSGITTLQGGGSGATTGSPPTAPQSGAVGLSGSNFIVNFPALLGTAGPGVSLGFILGRQATRVLDVQLSAIERIGRGKLLARPHLTTPNHERAWIESGREIPYLTQQISGGILTNTVAFKKASIELEVTPHVIETDSPRSVAIDVLVTRKEADFALAVQGNPSLISRTLLTRALVKEGETAVIGGLTTDDATETIAQVPLLGKIPVLGGFFRSRRVTEDKLQLMIFISPTILPTPLRGAETVPAPPPGS
jgi:type IV pilus assembly protein PilQ